MARPPEIPGSGQSSRASGSTPRSLLGRARAGEPAAWDRLVALYAPLVYQWGRALGLREPLSVSISHIRDLAVAVAVGLR